MHATIINQVFRIAHIVVPWNYAIHWISYKTKVDWLDFFLIRIKFREIKEILVPLIHKTPQITAGVGIFFKCNICNPFNKFFSQNWVGLIYVFSELNRVILTFFLTFFQLLLFFKNQRNHKKYVKLNTTKVLKNSDTYFFFHEFISAICIFFNSYVHVRN